MVCVTLGTVRVHAVDVVYVSVACVGVHIVCLQACGALQLTTTTGMNNGHYACVTPPPGVANASQTIQSIQSCNPIQNTNVTAQQ